MGTNNMDQRMNTQRPQNSNAGADESRMDEQFSALVKKAMLTPPQDLRKSVMTEIRAEKAKKRKLIYGIGAAAAAFVVFVGVIVAVRAGTASNVADKNAVVGAGEALNGGEPDNNNADVDYNEGDGADSNTGDAVEPGDMQSPADSEKPANGASDHATSEEDKETAMYWLGMYGATGGVVVVVNEYEMPMAAAILGQQFEYGLTIFAIDYSKDALDKLSQGEVRILDALDETEEWDVPLLVVISDNQLN